MSEEIIIGENDDFTQSPIKSQKMSKDNLQSMNQDTMDQRNPQGESPVRPQTKTQDKRKSNRSQNLSQNKPNENKMIKNNSQSNIDQLTEYAMAREGIELKDIEKKLFEQFLKECNGNAKLAQMRYEFKEAERQSLLNDIEMRKRMVQLELQGEIDQQQISNPTNQFFMTQPLFNSRFSKSSQSHTLLPNHVSTQSKREVDNKIFANILKNQIDQEMKLKQIKERQGIFELKNNKLQKKRMLEIKRKQEYMSQKQFQKEEKLRKQEEYLKQVQFETMQKLQQKSELSEQCVMRRKQQLRQSIYEKEMKHEEKKHYALEIFNQQQQILQEGQKEVQKRNEIFAQKQLQKQKQLQQYILYKKMKKEQILKSVQDQKDLENQKRMEKFMIEQMQEMEKEKRLKEEKQKEQQMRKQRGQEKNERIIFKVEEAYKKMEEWTKELERREQETANNLKKQQKILQQKLAMKKEMQRLKQESAQLKQKRKEMKQQLKKAEQLQKFQSISEKIDQYNLEKMRQKHMKQQQLFQAEQKRADIRTALYHMAVWNVQEAGEIIQDILQENEQLQSVKPISISEKIRLKAAEIRRQDRMGSESIMLDKNEIKQDNQQQINLQPKDESQKHHNTQRIVYDDRLHQ